MFIYLYLFLIKNKVAFGWEPAVKFVSLGMLNKIGDMRYTLRVNGGNGQIENIWSGNEMSEAIHFEAIAIKHWGKDNVWICDNLQEVLVG